MNWEQMTRFFFKNMTSATRLGGGCDHSVLFMYLGVFLGKCLLFSPSFHTTVAQNGLPRTTAKAPPDPMRSVPLAINASLDEKAGPAPFPLGRPVPRPHGVQPKVQIPVHGTEVSIAPEFFCAVVFIAT